MAAGPAGQAPSVKQAKLEKQAAEKRQKDADLWVAKTLAKMTLDEKIGQLIFTSFNAAYMSTDSDEFERLRHLVRDLKVGGIHVFGSAEALPQVMLNPVWGGGPASRKGDPYAAATTLNRLQSESEIPLLTSGDFEGGAAYILNGATRLPRAMVIGATGDAQMAFKAGVVAATEARAVGVNIDFYPVVDVNNNPRNPIINLRSFGEDPAFVSKMARGLHQGHPVDGRLRHRQALPRPRRHERRHAPGPRGHQPPARAARPGGTGAVQGGHRRRRRRGHVVPHRPSGPRPDAGHSRHAQPPDPHRAAAQRAEVQRPHLHRLDDDGRHLEDVLARQGRGDGREGRRGLRAALARRRRGVQGHQGGGAGGGDSTRRRSTRRSSGSCGPRRASGCT